jgi:hypothetical protein
LSFFGPVWARFERSDFSPKSDFLGRGFVCHFLGRFGHGLKNPIFPKNRISWAADFFVIFWAGLGTLFEKSDFSKKSDFLGSGFLGHFLGGLETSAFLH